MSASADNGANDGPPTWIRVPFFSKLQAKTSPSPFIPRSDFDDAYDAFQAVHMRGFVPPSSAISSPKCGADEWCQACDVQPLFESLDDQDKESWCIENNANHHGKDKSQLAPSDFLDVRNKKQRGYCSFLVQHSNIAMKDLFSNRLPLVHLPVANKYQSTKEEEDPMKVHYGPCLWIFFGKNYGEDGSSTSATLQGRPEHTDSVTHDGTWHYQLSGTKIWRLRPTTELLLRMKEKKRQRQETQQKSHSGTKRKIDDADGDYNNENIMMGDNCDDTDKKYIEVECKQGDILLLNTRLWWHSTLIPPQDSPCISYARDIYFPKSELASAVEKKTDSYGSDENEGSHGSKNNQLDQQESSMTNIDGTYAAEDIEAETVLFTEHAMPDCELHRSKTNPNCQVVELEDEKTGESYMAVVSLRCIKAGEFFCVLESDEEEGGGSEEEIEEWEEDDL
ncbi:hypothetical protein ACHAXR_007528 [Thalassiosira sp. AJA248-18]